MTTDRTYLERVRWRANLNAVELGFEYYLELLEMRLQEEEVSLVQGLRRYYRDELRIDLRETQARGLMHMSSSVFIDYVKDATGLSFTPGIQYWERQGLDTFLAWRQDFFRTREQQAADMDEDLIDRLQERTETRTGPAPRQEIIINRIIRDSTLSRFLKSLYQHRCQICTFTFRLPNRRHYAESHHVRPLGRTHRGIDKETNMLILCPNHHAMMDYGVIAIYLEQNVVLTLTRSSSDYNRPLQLLSYELDKEFLEYHLTNIFGKL